MDYISGIDFSRIDKETRPQDDFYQYVNGKWLKEFKLPADKSRYGTFTKLREKARDDVKKIIEEASSKSSKLGSDNQKVGDLYYSFMDTNKLEEIGVSSLDEEMKKIYEIDNISDLSKYFAYSDILTSAPFGIYVYIDKKNPSEHITYCSQSGLGLPNRGYYMDKDDKSENIKKEYINHVSKMFEMYGLKNFQKKANTVMKIETQLARLHWTKEKNRDPIATYNLFTFEDFKLLCPSIDWEKWEEANLLNNIDKIVVSQPDYMKNLDKVFKDTSIEDWKIYFSWKLLNRAANFLNNEFEVQNFHFYRTILSGVKEMEPRWKRAVNIVSGAMGEILGKVYVEKHFNYEAKKRMTKLVENIRKAYEIGIEDLDWMSDSTKVQAQDKLKKFTPKIGFPNKWKRYDQLSIDPENLVQNMFNSIKDRTKKNREKLGKPIDREEWGMTPQTVNAYYSPLMNEIVFPAAILQPPFFNMEADDAVNYGAIGAVIGHEMGHGFDDSGSQYDGNGKLRNWWTESDREKFEFRTKKLIEQYDKYRVLDGVNVNGQFTLGENIGDLAGIVIAYKAYQLSKKNKKDIIIDGLTGDERFFYGWATIWAVKSTNEAIRRQIKTDPHSPGEFRANGPLVNMTEFIDLFKVKKGDQMYVSLEDRIKIW
jgi:endothelin-converting enzyme/putative endopeptidase